MSESEPPDGATVTAGDDWKTLLSGPAAVMVLVLAGGAVAAATLLVGARGTDESENFVETPEFLVWGLLMVAQGALWAVGGAMFASSIAELRRRYAGERVGVWLATAAFAAVLVVVVAWPLIGGDRIDSPLRYHSFRVLLLGLFGGVAATLGVNAMARIGAAAKPVGRPALGDRLETFLFLRGELHVVVLFLGGMVGAVTLGSGALRQALITRGGVNPADFPPQSVLAYGAYFSLLLAAAYTPPYRAVVELGRGIRDDICGRLPDNPEDPETWAQWQARRAPVEDFLELKVTTFQRLQTALAILAPLVGGAVSLLLGTD